MRIEHFGGKVENFEPEEVTSILNIRFGKGVNEFWIYINDKYPCIGLMVKNEYAYIHFFPEEKHPGYQSVGEDLGLESGETTIFFTNTEHEEMEVVNDAIVSFSTALEAVEEFLTSSKKPDCIEWFEL